METAIQIRLYRSSDSPAIRQLACDTVDRGKPVDRMFRDREAVADVLVRGYMEHEAEHLWVAESENMIVGYLTGCLDTRSFNRLLERRIAPRAVLRSIGKGALLHLQTWHLLGALAGTVLLGGFPHRIDLRAYPAHFHINVKQGFRGRRIGQRLVDSFRRQVDLARLPGMHVVARGDNPGGRRFFEALGFRLLGEQPLILPEGRGFKRVSTVAYGWSREG